MNNIEIKSEKDFLKVIQLFEGGAKLIDAQYIACKKDSNNNDIRTIVLSFYGKQQFKLKFEEIDCVHLVPITMGSIYIDSIAVGKFRQLIFWSDYDGFDITSPDSSTSYVIGKKLIVAL